MNVIQVLLNKYQAQRDEIILNLEVLTTSRTTIPEHTQYVSSVDELIGQLAEINDKIDTAMKLVDSRENVANKRMGFE